jgi:hypothetical protein
MKKILLIITVVLLAGCVENPEPMKKVIFLHHSTGYSVWTGRTNKYVYRLTGKGDVQRFFDKYNRNNDTRYLITDRFFPKKEPYGWNNYPFDYYNIWVKNAGSSPYMDEQTLEILTREYDIIIFKHCYPGSNIVADSGTPDINSPVKSVENYKLQYEALKQKMHEFPDNKFIVWTPAVNTAALMTEEEGERTRLFHDWVINEWDEKGDNIFIWDFYEYETKGGLYLAEENAFSPVNSHPARGFATRVAPLFSKFVIDVIESKIE